MIFGSVINEDLKDEIVVTVIATGFTEEIGQQKPVSRPSFGVGQQKQPVNPTVKREREPKREEVQEPIRQVHQQVEDTLDIPTFLRNRNRRNQ